MCSIQSIITIVKIYTKQINSHSCCNVFKLSFFWVYYQYTKILNVSTFKGYCNERIPHYHVFKRRVKDTENCIMSTKCLGFFSIGQTIMTLLYRQTKGKIGLNFDTFIASLELRTSSVFVDSFYSDKTLPSMNLRVHKFRKS